MNKKEYQWRMEGFAWAVEMANKAKDRGEDPLVVLNTELNMRQRTGVFIFKRFKDAIAENETVKLVMVGALRAVAMISVWETFGFGPKRIERYSETYNRYIESLFAGKTEWTAVFELIESLGFTIDLSDDIKEALEKVQQNGY